MCMPSKKFGLPTKETHALEEFIKIWRNRKHTLGIMITGSYVIDLADEYSDIDLYIMLSDEATHRERGDHVLGGCVVEYNADPVRYTLQLQEEQYRAGLRHCARKLSTGRIVFDTNGAALELQRIAKLYMTKPFEKMSSTLCEMAKYFMWDQFEDLRRLAQGDQTAFAFAYYCGLQNILIHYGHYLGVEVVRPVRMYQFLTQREFRKKYCVDGFPDNEFVSLVANCMGKVDFSTIEKLTLYTQAQMGGFTLDGWKLKVPVPIKP